MAARTHRHTEPSTIATTTAMKLEKVPKTRAFQVVYLNSATSGPITGPTDGGNCRALSPPWA